MLTVGNERYTFVLYRRIENSYEYEETPYATFKGRPANQYEKRNFRILQGVNGNTDSQFIICTNLPKNIKPKDKIVFLGQEKIVESIGFYHDNSRLVNPGVLNDEYIIKRCPKGLNIQ